MKDSGYIDLSKIDPALLCAPVIKDVREAARASASANLSGADLSGATMDGADLRTREPDVSLSVLSGRFDLRPAKLDSFIDSQRSKRGQRAKNGRWPFAK